MKNLTLRQLKIFQSVASCLSFSRAAEELHLTQPAVSMQIRQLEEAAGLPLFEQLGKKIYLTDAGNALLRHCRAISAEIDAAGQTLAAMGGATAGLLNIGVVSTAKYFAPHLLARFTAQHPGVSLRLSVDNREHILALLQENAVDLAIMGRPPAGGAMTATAFAEHPMAIIAAPQHPLAGQQGLTPTDLLSQAFIVREPGSGTRATMVQFFAEHGATIRPAMEMASNETIKQAVMAGMGLAFLSLHTVALELLTGRLTRLDVAGLPIIRHWHVTQRRDKQLAPSAAAFRQFLTDRGGDLLHTILAMPTGK